MARTRQGAVQESIPFLRALEKKNAGTAGSPRIAMLKLLKQNPNRTVDEIATTLGYSTRTIKRWWKIYQTNGLGHLLGEEPASDPVDAAPDELDDVIQRLLDGEFRTLRELRQWLVENDRDDRSPQVDGTR